MEILVLQKHGDGSTEPHSCTRFGVLPVQLFVNRRKVLASWAVSVAALWRSSRCRGLVRSPGESQTTRSMSTSNFGRTLTSTASSAFAIDLCAHDFGSARFSADTGPNEWFMFFLFLFFIYFFYFIYTAYENNVNPAKESGGKNPVPATVALDRVCVLVWRMHVQRCMCACTCQKRCMRKKRCACMLQKMLAAQQKKNIVHFADRVKHCSHYGAKPVGHWKAKKATVHYCMLIYHLMYSWWYQEYVISKSKSMQLPVFSLWKLPRQNIKFFIAAYVSLHCCKTNKKKKIILRHLAQHFRTVHWQTTAWKEHVRLTLLTATDILTVDP